MGVHSCFGILKTKTLRNNFSASQLKHDIGYFINDTKSIEEIFTTIRNMSDGQKYHLLKKTLQTT